METRPASLAEREAGPFVEQILLLTVTFQSSVCGRGRFLFSVLFTLSINEQGRGGLSDRLSAAAPYLRLPVLSPVLVQPSQAVDASMDALSLNYVRRRRI